MKTDIWMPIYIRDYLQDTAHLNHEEHGFYLLTLMRLWQNGGTLTKERLRKIEKISPKKFEKKFKKISEFFLFEGDEFKQKRLKTELSKSLERRESASIKGKKGGRPKTSGLTPGKPTGKPQLKPTETSSSSPSPSLKKEEANSDEFVVGQAPDGTPEEVKAPPPIPTKEQKARIRQKREYVQNQKKQERMETADLCHKAVNYLNEVLGTKYHPTNQKTFTQISARKAEGFKAADFRAVIDVKAKEWKGTKFEKFLRPETLFGTKFEGYLNQPTEEQTNGEEDRHTFITRIQNELDEEDSGKSGQNGNELPERHQATGTGEAGESTLRNTE